LPLNERECRANRCILVGVTEGSIRNVRCLTPVFNDALQQVEQGSTWLLVWQRHDVVFEHPARNINVFELSGPVWRAVVFNAHAACLESARNVCQRAGVNKLSQQRCACFGVPPNNVHKPKPVKTEPGNVRVVNKVLLFDLFAVVFLPITANRHQLIGRFVDGYDVRPAICLFIFTLFCGLNNSIHQHFKDVVLVRISPVDANRLVFGVLGFVAFFCRLAYVFINICAALDHALNPVLGPPHQVGNTFCLVQIGSTVVDHHIFSRHEH